MRDVPKGAWRWKNLSPAESAARSKHMDATAFDIAMANHHSVAFEAAARTIGFFGFSFYPRSGFMHSRDGQV